MPCSTLHSMVPVHTSQMDQEATQRYIVHSCSLVVQKQLSLGDAHVIIEFVSDPLIMKFLRVTLDTYQRAQVDLCVHSVVQPQTDLPIHRSIFVYTSSRSMLEALDQRCDGHSGLPHAVLTSQSVRHVSFFPKQLVDLVVKTLVKSSIPSCASEIRELLTRLQSEEWTCPAENDEHVPEPVEDSVEIQEDEQSDHNLHAAEFILRCVHAGHWTSEQRTDVTSPSRCKRSIGNDCCCKSFSLSPM